MQEFMKLTGQGKAGRGTLALVGGRRHELCPKRQGAVVRGDLVNGWAGGQSKVEQRKPERANSKTPQPSTVRQAKESQRSAPALSFWQRPVAASPRLNSLLQLLAPLYAWFAPICTGHRHPDPVDH